MVGRIRETDRVERPLRHAEQVYRVVRGDLVDPEIDEVANSWQRAESEYRIDPERSGAPRILTSHELSEFRGSLDHLIHSTRDELDRLYEMVGDAGYTVLFCDTGGIAVEHRGDDSDASRFRYWGTWLGGVWAEGVEGTNGIGTCIVEQRPVTVHRGQHYRSRHTDLSCSGAPVFGVDGRLIAVLDVSAIDPDRSEHAHALTGPLTIRAAHSIEERWFREKFRREWIVATAEGLFLAVDADQRIAGANRTARTSLQFDDARLSAGVSLSSIFKHDDSLFLRRDAIDVPTLLVNRSGGEAWPVLLTAPERINAGWQQITGPALHTRPRIGLLASLRSLAPVSPPRGGLSSGAMRRVREYIEAHIGDSIELAALAAVAGLSMFHFARQFKESTGVTPHSYLVRRRIERAQQMLAESDLSLSEIAFRTGFSDQSHLTRHFRQTVGVTPAELRRLRR